MISLIPGTDFVFLVFAGISTLLYALLMANINRGWFSLPVFERKGGETAGITVSLVIAVRNEEDNILHCLEDCSRQDYPGECLEIIVVDDQSEDQTCRLVEQFIRQHPELSFRLEKMSASKIGSSKKSALTYGISLASGTLIITTDADCRLSRSWVSVISSFFAEFRPEFLAAPVLYENDGTLFTAFQSLEFQGLMASTAGSIQAGFPLMCNGANMAFNRKAFLETGGYLSNQGIVSGDDVFLMMNIRKKYGRNAVAFLKNQDAIVWTKPPHLWKDFLNQRMRWVSKARGYRFSVVLFSAIVVYLMNVFLASGLIIGLWNARVFLWIFAFFLVKIIVDLPVLAGMLRFSGSLHLLAGFLPLQLINLYYVSIIGPAGLIRPFTWKGRKSTG